MNIEIAYLIIFAVMIVTLILTVSRKMSVGIGIIGIGVSAIACYLLSDYMNIVMLPLTQALFYGGVWGIPAILGLAHIISMVWMIIVAIYNLMSSGGKITWA